MNPMRNARIEKITLNIGAGKDQNKLDKAQLLLKHISGIDPVKTFTNKRIPSWGLRPGLPIGCKLTLRKEVAFELLKRLLEAKDHVLRESQFDGTGNISFGIPEYIDIPGVKYDPKIGIIGLQVCVTLERPGFRVKRRSLKRKKLGKKHDLTKEEAMEFMKKSFNVKIGESG
ncbi:50S ribosomal protein L5 [Candidatus Woesearchaeota archaeon]|nr:50S ribosomal protein L5 [Candidatus Woesearchaeota archaeon]